ncbi:hypothetical protein MLD38_031760 [Melastoma candidum]|uniref:Uncharacterized protein n=1 Tax=Melastoma candidum TaxID=119954 RepID=A0ACB9MRA1_9MYRT|nr:hypothetical protein MLD38_031760 [Melastoma candidum]
MAFRIGVTVAVVVSTLFLVSTSAVAIAHETSKTGDLISKLCKKTDYVDLCVSSVRENIKGEPTGVSILIAEVDAVAKATKEALAQAVDLSKLASSKREVQILSTCKECYDLAISSVADAKVAIAKHDGPGLNNELSAILTFATTCEDSYQEASLPSPLKTADQLITNLGGNCFEIANEIGLGVST